MGSINADALAQVVLEKYKSLPTKLKVQVSEWTVLAGIVAWNRGAIGSAEEYQVITLATGTKCLASASLVDGYVIRDSHAEVLCRRALCLLLYEDIQLLQSGEQSRLLVPRNGKYVLRDDVSLHLVISDSPCGCASEFNRIVVGNVDSQTIGNPRVSGAKRVKKGDDDDACSDTVAELYNLRTKPFRSDLPIERRSQCMSCSDKISKWQMLGLQGALLNLLGVETIRLTSVVLLKDAALTCIDGGEPNQESLSLAKSIVLDALQSCLSRFDDSKTIVDLSLNHSFTNSRVRICPPAQGKEKKSSAGKCTWWAINGSSESLVGVRGVKEGASKHAESIKVASILSKAMLLQKFTAIYNSISEKRVEAEIKDLDSIASTSPQTYSGWKKKNKRYRERLEEFRQRVKQWNINEAFDEFIIEC